MENKSFFGKVHGWFTKRLVASPDSTGINSCVLILAALFTVVVYFLLNISLILWLHLASSSPLPGTEKTNSPKQMAANYIKTFEADPKLQGWIETYTRPSQSYAEQITHLIATIQSSAYNTDEVQERMTKKLEFMLQGAPSTMSFWIFVTPHKYSGAEILSTVIEDKSWYTELEKDSMGVAKQEFLEKFINQAMLIYNIPVRFLFRINGWIQYLLVFGFMIATIVLFQRNQLINRARQNSPEGEALRAQLPSTEKAEECVYRPISSIIAMLPSMGFIGTVLGMGGALLEADQLFAATDKSMIMAKLTQQLGFAFDTTFVALVLALLLELAFTKIRTAEARISGQKNDVIQAKTEGTSSQETQTSQTINA